MGIYYDPRVRKWNVTYEKTDYPTNLKTDYPESETYRVKTQDACVSRDVWGNCTAEERWETKSRELPENIAINNANRKENSENQKLNAVNTGKNKGYDTIVATASSTQGGDYVAKRESFRAVPLGLLIAGVPVAEINAFKENLINEYKTFYRTEKLQQWNPALGAKPPYGEFDPNYYKSQNPQVQQQWASAVSNDDIDITERYGENGFYLQHYTTQGKPTGARGNAAEITAAANAYIERKPTDLDIQAVRELQLGVDTQTQTDRLLAVPQIAEEWNKAKGGDPYWDSLAKQHYLDVNKKDEFVALFRLSERPEDKQVAFNFNANTGYGITELEDVLNEAVGEKAQVDVKRFGALAQNVLKDTIAELTKAKQKEQMLDLMGGFSGFNEIININQTLADSILGDTGVGGVLSFTSAGKAEESLLKNLQGITGVQNNNTYNWQQWFDNTLKQKYSQAQ